MRRVVIFLVVMLMSVQVAMAQQPEYKEKAFFYAEQFADCAAILLSGESVGEEVEKKIAAVGDEMASYYNNLDKAYNEPFFIFFDKAIYYYFGKKDLDKDYAERFLELLYIRITDAW